MLLRINIDPGGREHRFVEVCYHPSILFIPVALDFPLTRRKFEPAFPSPLVRCRDFCMWSIESLDVLLFVVITRLERDSFLDATGIAFGWSVCDDNITIGLPHRQGRVRDMPCSVEEI